MRHDAPVSERWPLADGPSGRRPVHLRRFWCPGCAVQVDVELALAGEEPYAAAELR